jgi:hypothetical protein
VKEGGFARAMTALSLRTLMRLQLREWEAWRTCAAIQA